MGSLLLTTTTVPEITDIWEVLAPMIGIVIAVSVVLLLIGALIGSLIQALFYMLSFKIVAKDAEKQTYGGCYGTSFFNALVGWIPCLGWLIAWAIISKRHGVSYGNAILVWLVAIIIPTAISSVIGFLSYASLWALIESNLPTALIAIF